MNRIEINPYDFIYVIIFHLKPFLLVNMYYLNTVLCFI